MLSILSLSLIEIFAYERETVSENWYLKQMSLCNNPASGLYLKIEL